MAEAGWHAVAVDLRGHGESDWTEQYGYQDFAADVISLVGQIGGPSVLVGASLGGISALIAQDGGEGALCRSLVLVDIVPRANPAGVERILSFMEAGQTGFDSMDKAADTVAADLRVRERRRPKDFSRLRKNLRQRADGRWYWYWDPQLIESTRHPSRRPSGLLEDAARRLTIPTLLVRGRQARATCSPMRGGQGVPAGRSLRALPRCGRRGAYGRG